MLLLAVMQGQITVKDLSSSLNERWLELPVSLQPRDWREKPHGLVVKPDVCTRSRRLT